MKKFLLLALSQLFAISVFADGFPRFYELVRNNDDLTSGKYYIIVAVYAGSEGRIAYNGFDSETSLGKAGSCTPYDYNRIIDIGETAVPLKMSINTTISTETNTVWNFVDESTTPSTLIGVNTTTENELQQHYLIDNTEWGSNNNYSLWSISIDANTHIATIQNVGKIAYYLKYDYNSNMTPQSLFRVYGINEKWNVMLFKEMETITAETYFTGHGTLYYSNKVLMVPADVEAMTMTYDAKKKEVDCSTLYATGSFIPAGSAVVLHNTRDESTFPAIGSADTYTFPVTTRHAPTLDKANILSGLLDEDGYTTTGGNDNDYYFYKMTTKNNTNPGFYWANNDGSRFKMPNNSNKAYLALPKSTAQNVRSFLLDFIKTPTSINQIPSPNTQHPSPDGDVFDLSGRRVSTSQSLPKGIYISNGKKFVVK